MRWSLFARVGTTAALILAFMTVIACLLIIRVVEDSASYDRTTFLRLSMEFGFVLIVFLLYVANLIRGLARVVDRGLREQVDTLEQSRTVLGARRAVVGTGDEIGLVATELNGLLDTLEQTTRTAARANEAMIRGLVGLAGARDNETGLHLKRTQLYLTELCRELARHRTFGDALTEEAITRLVAAAPLHDIGKVAIPDAILRKPGKLTDAEFAIMKTHVTEGLRVIDDVIAEVGATPFLSTVHDVIAGHHERYDGRGYPFGLAADAIPLAGRLMAVADVYDALRSARVYKPAMSREEARRIIEDGAGSHFDPRIVAAFLAVEPEIHRHFKPLQRRGHGAGFRPSRLSSAADKRHAPTSPGNPLNTMSGETGVVPRGRHAPGPHVGGGGALEGHDAVLAPALGALLAHGDAGDVVVELGDVHGAQRRERAAVDGLVEGDIQRVAVLIGRRPSSRSPSRRARRRA